MLLPAMLVALTVYGAPDVARAADTAGVVVAAAGSGQSGYGGDGGDGGDGGRAAEAQFSQPRMVTFDAAGRLEQLKNSARAGSGAGEVPRHWSRTGGAGAGRSGQPEHRVPMRRVLTVG